MAIFGRISWVARQKLDKRLIVQDRGWMLFVAIRSKSISLILWEDRPEVRINSDGFGCKALL